jgi:hypothetical protein
MMVARWLRYRSSCALGPATSRVELWLDLVTAAVCGVPLGGSLDVDGRLHWDALAASLVCLRRILADAFA